MKILAEINLVESHIVMWLSRGDGGCIFIGEIYGNLSIQRYGKRWMVGADSEEYTQFILADLIQQGKN